MKPGIWAPFVVGSVVGARRLIGRSGGYVALSVVRLFWLLVYLTTSLVLGLLEVVVVPVYLLYATLPLAIPVIGLRAVLAGRSRPNPEVRPTAARME